MRSSLLAAGALVGLCSGELVAAAPDPTPAGSAAERVAQRLSGRADGLPVEVEVRDLPREAAERAAQGAYAELQATLAATRPGEGAFAALAATPDRPVAVEPRVLRALAVAQAFCVWSEGRVGPLGGRAYELWGLRRPVAALPDPAELEAASQSAACNRLQLDLAAGTARLAAGSAIDLWGVELGWAVDRAVEVLRDAGATNFWLRLGEVYFGAGPGPSGLGWTLPLPLFPGQTTPLPDLRLRDRALVVLTPDDRPLAIAGERFAPYLDLRSGRPAGGLVAVLASTLRASEAQAVGTAMFVGGSRQGALLLGTARPAPAVLWLIGSGEGEPVISSHHWSELRQ